jgi:hypothetical protein
MEKKPSVTVMSDEIRSAGDADATQTLTMPQSGAVQHLPRSQSWDPYEVWLNRVHRPRAEQDLRDALKTQAPIIRDAGGGVSPSPLTIVQTLAR